LFSVAYYGLLILHQQTLIQCEVGYKMILYLAKYFGMENPTNPPFTRFAAILFEYMKIQEFIGAQWCWNLSNGISTLNNQHGSLQWKDLNSTPYCTPPIEIQFWCYHPR